MLNNVVLRQIESNDTEKIIKWRNSDLVMQYFIDRNELTKEIHNQWLKTKVATKEVYQFIACDVDSDVDFASTYIKDINANHKKAEFGIFIGEKDYIGKGYGRIITSKTIDFGFNVLGLNKIYARVLSYNKASYNMFKKLGFHEDALLREDVIINEKTYDVFIVSILKNEWFSKKGNHFE